MPHSAVTRIELNDNDTINIMISIDGFEKGTPIELYGQVIQDNGAVGTFYSIQEFPVDPDQTATLTVPSISAAEPKVFVAQFPVTVIARAAEVWISQLGNDTANGALQPRGIPVGSGPLKGPETIWAVNGCPPDSSRGSLAAPVSISSDLISTRQRQRALTHRSSSRTSPDTIQPRLFPRRSPQRSSANAARGGLEPLPAERLWRASNLHLSYSTALSEAPSLHLPRSCSQQDLQVLPRIPRRIRIHRRRQRILPRLLLVLQQ